jgi:hypothetical protein
VAVPDNDAAAAFGFVLVPPPTPPEPPPVELWAEHWPAVRLFMDMRGQWRAGPSGAYSLDHAALPAHARPGYGGRRGRRIFEHLQVMEDETLLFFAEQRDKVRG